MKRFDNPHIQALAKPLAAGAVLTCVLGYSIYQLLFHNFFHGAMRVVPTLCALVLLAGLWVVCGSAVWDQLHGTSPKAPEPELDAHTITAAPQPPKPEPAAPQPDPQPVCAQPSDSWQAACGKEASAPPQTPPSEMDEKVRKAQEESQKHLEQQARKRQAEQARWNAKGQKYVEDAKHLQEKRLQEMEQPANWKPTQSKKR